MVELAAIGHTSLSLTAAGQSMIGLGALAQENAQALTSYLGESAQVVAFEADHATWPVDFVIVRQNDTEWFIVIRGTTNIGQWSTNVIGAAGIPYRLSGATAHAGFLAQARRVGLRLQQLLATAPAPTYFGISGHSLGGAAGQLLAWSVKDAYPTAQVELLTFGAPQAATYGPRSPTLDAMWRVCDPADGVPYLPSNVVTWVYGSFIDPGGWLGLSVPYRHYGQLLSVDAAGDINDPHPDPYPLPDGVQTDPVGRHELQNYWGRMRQVVLKRGGPVAALAAFETARPLITSAPRQVLANVPTSFIQLPDGTYVPVPGFTPAVGERSGASTMANPNNELTNGVAYGVTIYFIWGQVGWSETYWAYMPNTIADPEGSVIVWANRLVQQRKACLADVVEMNYVRIARLTSPKKSRVLTAATITNLGAGDVSGEVNLKQAVSFRGVSADGTKREVRELRGWTKGSIRDLGSNPLRAAPLTPAGLATAQPLITFLTTPYVDTNGVARGMAAIKTFAGGAGFTPQAVQSLTLNSDGYIVIHMTPGSLPVIQGEKVTLRHKRQSCISGLSGRYAVDRVATGGPTDDITLHKKYCCPPALLAQAVVTAQRYDFAWWGQNEFFPWQQTTRKTGRPFGLLRGRGKGCCP